MNHRNATTKKEEMLLYILQRNHDIGVDYISYQQEDFYFFNKPIICSNVYFYLLILS
jgi:hypothetical protein